MELKAVYKLVILLSPLYTNLTMSQSTYGNSEVHAEFDAKCSDTEFVVYFNKTSLDSRNTPTNNRTFTIKFAGTSESACRVVGTSSINTTYDSIESTVFTSNISIGTKFSENMCGINVLSDDTHIIFNTTIIVTYGENPKDFIRREEYDYYSVMCLMNRTVDGKLSGDKVDVTMRKDGKAARNTSTDFSFALAHTDMNGDSQSSYKMGDYIKFNMSMSTSRDVRGVIQNCRTTSDGFSNDYNLIKDRCTLEVGTSWVTNPNGKVSVFKTEAFQYSLESSTTAAVYVECLVRVCLISDNSIGCSLCTGARRKRRALSDMNNFVNNEESFEGLTVVKSPAFLIINEDQQQQQDSGSSSNQSSQGVFDGTNGTVVIILLALLVVVTAFAVFRRFVSSPTIDRQQKPVSRTKSERSVFFSSLSV